jgi:hypothetical protein
LCDNLSAGNLKKMKRNSEPSKKHETNASTRIFVSVLGQYIGRHLQKFGVTSKSIFENGFCSVHARLGLFLLEQRCVFGCITVARAIVLALRL